MEDDTKVSDETTDETETQASGESEESQVSTDDSEPDYKAELEKERERLKKAEYTIQRLKQTKDSERGETSESNDDDWEEKIGRVIDERLSRFEARTVGTLLEAEIQKVARNADHGELIKFHLENTIKPTGDRAQDVQLAAFIADKNRVERERSEAQRALKSKQTAGNGSGSGTKVTQTKKAPEIPANMRMLMKDHKWNPKTDRFEGKHTFFAWNKDQNKWDTGTL